MKQFFQENNGHFSMTRLIAIILAIGAVGIAILIVLTGQANVASVSIPISFAGCASGFKALAKKFERGKFERDE